MEDMPANACEAARVSSCDDSMVEAQRACSSEFDSTEESFSIGQDIQSGEGQPCELDKPEYKTDKFRLYQFKIKQCTNEEAHDWCLCPFAHPGEKAQRRDPRLFKYTGISCPDYRKGTCKRGNACPYAHGVFEVWLHPSRYRTQTCKDAPHCTRQVCFFAHTLEEVRQVEPQDLPVLVDSIDALSGACVLQTSDADSADAEGNPAPRCGSNTNVKAAAAAKAKAAAAAAAAASASSAPSSSSSAASSAASSASSQGNLDWTAAAGLKLMSRQGSTCSTSQLTGLESLGSLSSALCTPSLSLLSTASSLTAAQQGAGLMGPPAGLLGGSAGVAGMAGLAAAGNGGLLQVPTDIAIEAAALRAAAGISPICDTFGSLDLNAAAAAAAAAAVSSAVSGAVSPAIALDAFGGMGGGGVAVGMGGSAAWGSGGLPAPCLGIADASLPGQFGGAGNQMNSVALAAAAHRAVATQHAEMHDMLHAVLLRQHQLATMQQQQHRDAMWAAAYNAAAEVGLNPMTAAACADAAVQTTTTAAAGCAAPPGMTNSQQGELQMHLLMQQQQSNALAAAVSRPMGVLPAGHMVAAGPSPMKAAGPHFAHQQQPQLGLPAGAGAMIMQQASMLAHCDALVPKQFGGFMPVGALTGPLQVSVTAGTGAFGGMQ